MSLVVFVLGALAVAFVITLGWIFLWLFRTPAPKPCYRCGGVAEVEYMGLHYCEMCRLVIVAMISTVQHDPPYGFPGARGYLEFPEKELK